LELANLGPELNDIGDTAAVMSLMDLIITTDTSVPHLAGALGRPVWLMLQFAPDFRWLLEREDSPWYPTMRLFRQKSPGDWNGVIGRVAEALGAYRV
jgi:ADP-heptose:LPS heptosyltransferase